MINTLQSSTFAGCNISYPQIRLQRFSASIFRRRQLIGLTGNRVQSTSACSFLRYKQSKTEEIMYSEVKGAGSFYFLSNQITPITPE